ncbi:MAG: ABC transporter related [Microgenomates bacterium 39_6]|nr:MAG: ABC transporter related [Microgenomates bacterium 39_6]
MENNNSQPIISVKNLTKNYNGLTAVDDISFAVQRGEVFAFLGPNGAGKTTTIKILTTLLRPTKGELLINGYNPVSQQNKVRESFGIVFQDSSLDDELTAWENMEFHGVLYKVPKDKRRKRMRQLLEIVDLWERRDSVVKTYSGGMRRRLEIARALLHHPQIFFMDEPTLGLDPQTRNKIWQHIHELNQQYQTTIFFTTHYMEEAEKMAGRIAIIDHGQIVALGSVDELEKETHSKSLEETYLKITGKAIREEEAGSLDKMRQRMQRRRK